MVSELINDTENGFLVQPKKPEEIAKTCLGLVDDQEKNKKYIIMQNILFLINFHFR